MKKEPLCMKFDMNTIQHLGISMYSKLPPVLGELVANAWDADANKVTIILNDLDAENKSIIIEDDGNGMDWDEINDKFLVIGRNRRVDDGSDETPGGRKVIGRKGIGKLSIFGIAEEITITTIKNNKKNTFKMILSEIKKRKKEYSPEHSEKDVQTDGKGTKIILGKLRRKSKFFPREIAFDLAKRFMIFDKNFRTAIVYNEDAPFQVENDFRFENINKQFTWKFPNNKLQSSYKNKSKVIGEIHAAESPVSSTMKGVYLVARGKLVHRNDFYGVRADDYAHSYITGWLNIDFIDEDSNTDLISTNRESLTWENEEMERLQEYLKEIINFVARERKARIQEKRESRLITEKNIDIPRWIESLPEQERKLAQRMTSLILKDSDMNIDKSAQMIGYVQDSFEYGSFKEFASQLEETDDITALDIVKLFQDWRVIEAKEMYKLAIVRVQTIEKFEQKIKENAKEKPEIHDFLKTFPWLLDPRIMQFEDEVTYSEILREKFKEPEDIPEENKRIDFLCIDLANTIFIIELKRPNLKANGKYLDQALEYASFIKEKKGNDPEFSKRDVRTYLVCGGIVDTPQIKAKAKAYANDGVVHIRTYIELLASAKNYHKDFIKKYEELKKLREDEDN